MCRVVINLCRTQKRLGRNAAPIEADAAKMFTLDNGSLETELRGADRSDIAAGAGTDDENVIGSHV